MEETFTRGMASGSVFHSSSLPTLFFKMKPEDISTDATICPQGKIENEYAKCLSVSLFLALKAKAWAFLRMP
jgi:hypothetical protein